MKVPKSIRFLTKKGKDKEEKELRKWNSNPDLKNEAVIDGNPKEENQGDIQAFKSDSYLLIKCSIFTYSIFNIAFGTIYDFLK
ncbi:Oidioi.mRNA.OKI2018_I69.chr1.g624.t1.cds [Oikopleura dioica]|uniref:Oidioi.mRNA.OKI2018_I69.chr1.g624.t1.cds n=1 Tax=Oikopleura dioica TaxID=34765 RepID=A0ABN7SRP7_OIKDI|nr:Oidioi.mRNA.OKI2018_I69.chr1.g624.t1.cds [Oikopleura dioica]